MATRKTLGRLAACVITAGVSLPASAQQQPPDGNPVPYSARSREARTAAERTAQVRCIAQATSAFANYAGPQTARENAAGAFFMSCVLKQMPSDWPLGTDVHDQAGKMADAARRADPAIDACLLTACTVEKDGDASK